MKLIPLAFRVYCNYCSKINSRFFYDSVTQKEYTVVNEEAIKSQFHANSVRFTEGYTCFRLKTCFCGQTSKNPGVPPEVFVNKRTGFFLCGQCKITADWESYSFLFSKGKSHKISPDYFEKEFTRYDTVTNQWEELVNKTQSLEYLTDKACAELLQSFNLNPVQRSVIELLGIRINMEKDVMYFPIYQSECIVGYKILKKSGEESVFPRVNCPGILKFSKDSKTRSAVVVAKIPDFLTLVALHLYNYDIICLPYGKVHISQSSLPAFEKYNKIILWLGDNSVETTGKIADKFYEKRCYLVKPSEKQISASAALSNQENIQNILTEAKLTCHQYVTTFNSFRDAVLAELQNETEIIGIPWKKFPTLTQVLKGHRRGELTILTGPTGVGKTTFLSEYSLDLASQGVYTLWGSFEIKNVRLAKIMLTQFSGGSLPLTLPEFNELCSKFEQLPLFFLTFHGQQKLLTVMEAIRHCSYIYDIAHVIIDNVQFMIEVSSEVSNLDRFSKQDYMIQMFRSFASQNNCHVTLVMHPKKTESLELDINSIFGGVKASQEADNVLIMQKRDCGNSTPRKFLEVVKNRFSGDLGTISISFDKESLSFKEKKYDSYDGTIKCHENFRERIKNTNY